MDPKLTIQQECLAQFVKIVAELEDATEVVQELNDGSSLGKAMASIMDRLLVTVMGRKTLQELTQMVFALLESENEV